MKNSKSSNILIEETKELSAEAMFSESKGGCGNSTASYINSAEGTVVFQNSGLLASEAVAESLESTGMTDLTT